MAETAIDPPHNEAIDGVVAVELDLDGTPNDAGGLLPKGRYRLCTDSQCESEATTRVRIGCGTALDVLAAGRNHALAARRRNATARKAAIASAALSGSGTSITSSKDRWMGTPVAPMVL